MRWISFALFSILSLQGLTAAASAACTPTATALCLQSGRFRVEVIGWEDYDANTGVGRVLPFGSDTTGFFWFVDPDLPELYVRLLDGTALNGFYWVFIGPVTDWEHTVRVTDTATGAFKDYFNPLGTIATVTDTAAFPAGPAAGGEMSQAVPAADAADKGGGGVCTPSATELCLDGGRFRIEVGWRDIGGGTGPGRPVPLTPQAGYFWFFAADSVEMLVKIVDGGADNGHFWFYYGTTTSVEYTITVTDICTGAVKTYFNPQGTFTSDADFMAFPSTPTCILFADGFESGDTSAWSRSVGG